MPVQIMGVSWSDKETSGHRGPTCTVRGYPKEWILSKILKLQALAENASWFVRQPKSNLTQPVTAKA